MADKKFPLSVIIKGIDKISAPLRGAAGAIRGFGNFASRVNIKMRAFGERTGLPVLGKAIGRVGGSLSTLGKQIGLIGGLFGGVALAGAGMAFRLIKSFADTGSALNDTSKAIGINVEYLQELQFAGRQSGVANEELSKSLGILQKNLGNAFLKQGPALKFLTAAKIKLKGMNGQLRPTEELLPEIADGLMKIKAPGLRAAAVTSIFGKAGLKLLPMLENGSKGLADFAKEARRLNIIMSKESVGAADDFGDAWDKLKDAIFGTQNAAGAGLLPVVNKLIGQLTEWIVKKGPQIRAFFNDFGAKLPGRIDEIIKVFGELMTKLKPVWDIFMKLNETFGTSNVIIGVLAGALIAALLPAVISVSVAFWELAAAMWANPIGLIVLLVVGAAAALIYFNTQIHDGKMKLGAFGTTVLWFFNTFTPLGQMISQFIYWDENMAKAKARWDTLADGMKSGFNTAIQWALKLRNTMVNLLPAWAQNMLGGKMLTFDMGKGFGNQAPPLGAANSARAVAAAKASEVRVIADFKNLPQGTKVTTETRNKPNFTLNQGRAASVN